MFTARLSFVLFAFLAFVFTMLYLGWVHQHEGPVINHQSRAEQSADAPALLATKRKKRFIAMKKRIIVSVVCLCLLFGATLRVANLASESRCSTHRFTRGDR